MTDAAIVGSGPNGLAAAITLARAGRSVEVFEAAPTAGGGLLTDEVAPGVWRDHCAAVFPLGIGSPFLRQLPLADFGLEWIVPDVSFAHPVEHDRAGVAYRSLDETVAALGVDGNKYRRWIAPASEAWEHLAHEILGPIPHIPRHPITLARFGLPGLQSSQRLANKFETDEVRAMIAGCAAHGVMPLDRPLTGAFAAMFTATAHAQGWPVVAGGAGKLATAMISYLESLGGVVHTNAPVSSLDEVGHFRAVLFDTNPAQLDRIAGDRLPGRYRRKLRTFKHGPGIFKVDFLIDGPVPWANGATRRSPTVHVGGLFDECAAAEAAVAHGDHPEHPFVLLAQPDVVDPTRTPDSRQLIWAYTHVPAASTVDMTSAIERQIERFAPGFRDLITERFATGPAAFEASNANLVGGDITGGTVAGMQLAVRPRLFRPYTTPNPGLFLCSASTPPGAGVHGMCGHLAANAALRGVLKA